MSAPTKPESTSVARREQPANVSRRDRTDTFREKIGAFTPTLLQVLPEYVKPERMIALTLTAATKNPDLFECTLESVALAMLQIAQWDLEIGRTAYLVPFGKTCTAIPAWQGLTELMLRSGHVKDIKARAVYSNEHFRVEEGDSPSLNHVPIYDDKKRGDLTAFYAVAFLVGGRATFEVMTVEDVNKIRNRAKSKNSDAWNNHFVEMGKKTVIRRMAKRMPQNVQSAGLRSALSTEDRLDAGDLLEAIRAREPELSRIQNERPRQMIAAANDTGSYDLDTTQPVQSREPATVQGAPRTAEQRATAASMAAMKDPYGEQSETSGEVSGGGVEAETGQPRERATSSDAPRARSTFPMPFKQGGAAKSTPIGEVSTKDLSDAVRFAAGEDRFEAFVDAANDELERRRVEAEDAEAQG